jgi:hypothetical protein
VEAEKKQFKHIHEVVGVMKSAGIVAKYWGKNAHITSTIERDKDGRIVLLPGDLQRLSSMARDHVNFNASMTSDVLTGVEKLDKAFVFQDVNDPDKEVGMVTRYSVTCCTIMCTCPMVTRYLLKFINALRFLMLK